MPAETLVAGRVRMRLRPWRPGAQSAEDRDHGTAELTSTPAGLPVPPELVIRALDRAAQMGFHLVVTPALPRDEWQPYLDLGFEMREQLHLLSHDLLDLAPRPRLATRRVSRRHHDQVLAIDHRSFEPFWRLDGPALHEAIRATPSVRFRLTRAGTGYLLCGRAGDRGYVQRLAVDPDDQGRGVGTDLVLDGLHWLRRWRAREALVNTQIRNQRAVDLYERLGFRRRRNGLAVLQASVHP